jgi:hypothetical protein
MIASSANLQLLALVISAPLLAQEPRELMTIPLTNSAEAAWAKKPVLARRVLDDKSDTSAWRYSGTATFTFQPGVTRSLRVDMQMFSSAPAPTRNRLSSVNLRRVFPNEDWSGYNRLLIWVRTDFNPVPRPADGSGFPVIPFQFVLHSEGKDTTPDRYGREGIHYVSFMKPGVWQPIYWEIDPLPRDHVSSLEIGYWVNKMLAAPSDRVSFEIGDIELQRVEPDVHTGWNVGTGRIAVSPAFPSTSATKTAVTTGISARTFQVIRGELQTAPRIEPSIGHVVLSQPIRNQRSRLGEFQVLDFSSLKEPGAYILRAGNVSSRPFIIGPPDQPWWLSLQATLNFFYGNRCGFAVPGVHNEDHKDWFATLGDQKVSMSGGWHDAGDLSQGIINTGEATYAMFALAERLGENPLRTRLLEEAKWGLDWLTRVRFPGGYKVYFSSHNLWTDNVVGDADDRSREMKNNPNANYIAAAAEAIAYRVLKERDPALAARALELAKEDWEYAINGVEDATTRTTPAFAASQMELAGIGITASVELFRATNDAKYRDKAQALAQIILDSQQQTPVGDDKAWSGFFYTAPNRDTLFHQFHRGNDQAPIVALVQLLETFPSHADAARWRKAVQLHLDFQKRGAATTAPWNVLPAYVYRTADAPKEVADSGALHGATRPAYVEQVKAGLPLGGDWYLRAMPVAFARRGNYGVLLSQTKALSVAARFLRDSSARELAEKQLQWVMGRNPFAQSTMYGVGFGWSQQYSVSSGDFYGSLPVGIQNRGTTDLPYWPTNNMYVWKEVWMHPSARWLWILADLMPQ